MSAPEFRDDELAEFDRIHDRADTASTLNALEMAWHSVKMPPCAHCGLAPRMRPGQGTSWLLEHVHEAGCIELDLED